MTETYTDRLQQLGYDAEDSGSEVYYAWHDEFNVLNYLEIDGVEHVNPEYDDEVRDASWQSDSYTVAEVGWRE